MIPAMRHRTLLFSALVAVAGLIAPAQAAAIKKFTGKTQQNRTINLTIGDDGTLESGNINWITRRCAQSGSRFQNITRFTGPYDQDTPEAFSDSGAYTVRDRGRIRSRVSVTLSGQHFFDPANPAAEKWVGTFKATVVVRRRGRVIDRCRLRSTTWEAGLAP
jgi:tRNA/tmRNA/rRNA uracil-C5-methylase (TrmA/RlmC/RlmD family)